MFDPRKEQGKGQLGNIAMLVIAVIGIYLALQFILVRIDAYAFKDAMVEQASFASTYSNKAIHANLLRRARELELPIEAKQITVKRDGVRCVVEADYTVDVETIFFTYPWKFQPKVIREVF